MEEVEVVETVRRGWSGGTACADQQSKSATESRYFTENPWKHIFLRLTLDHQIDYDRVKAQSVGGSAGVISRILCFDWSKDQGSIG